MNTRWSEHLCIYDNGLTCSSNSRVALDFGVVTPKCPDDTIGTDIDPTARTINA
jgi:hypothetical protein